MTTFNAEKALTKLQNDLTATKESIENILNNVEGEGEISTPKRQRLSRDCS